MKTELQKLHNLLTSWGNLYQDNMVISASVVVQNMAFNADEWSWDEFKPYLDILDQMKGYNKHNHVLQWAYDEAFMTIEGYFMSQEDYLPEITNSQEDDAVSFWKSIDKGI